MSNTGGNVGSFGGGFAKGLANVLYRNQQTKREDEQRAQQRRDQLNIAMLPHVFDNATDVADVEPWLQQSFPDVFGVAGKKVKPSKDGTSSPMDHVTNVFKMLKPHFGPGGASGTGNDLPQDGGITGNLPRPNAISGEGGTGVALAQATSTGGVDMMPAPPATTVIPGTGIPVTGTPAAATPPARKTFMGVPIMTPTEKADRAALGDTAKIEAKVRVARQLFATGVAKSMEEAMDYVGLYNMHAANGAGGMRAIPGKDKNGKAVMAVFRDGGFYYAPGEVDDAGQDVAGKPIPGFIQRETTGQRNPMGTIGTQAAVALGYDSVQAAIDAGKHKEITNKIEELLREQNKQRALGTGQGQFESPIGVKDAQATSTVVGSTSADYAGQRINTAAETDRRRGLETLQSGIQRILDLNMLGILPTEKSLAGMAPGAAITMKRRTNMASGLTDENGKPLTNREAMARLDSNIDNLVNAMARVVAEQRGAQTEADATRAYNALVSLKTTLMDPLAGDTQGSAAVRIREAQAALVRVLQGMDSAPAPGAKPKAAAAGTGTGPDPANPKAPYKDASGNWIIP